MSAETNASLAEKLQAIEEYLIQVSAPNMAAIVRVAADRLETGVAVRQALEETQSLLTAMLHEQRPESEIKKQIGDNRVALIVAQRRRE